MKQIGFIVGSGRCGSTVLSQILNAHSKICVPPELQFIVGLGSNVNLYEEYHLGNLPRFECKDFISIIKRMCPNNFELYFDYVSYFKNLKYPQLELCQVLKELFTQICMEKKKEVFIEQTPWHGLKLKELKSLFPDMKVIHIIRDGRDVAVSLSRVPWGSKDIDRNLLLWAHRVNTIQEYGNKNPDTYIDFRYEDLIKNYQDRYSPEIEKTIKLFNLNIEKTMFDRHQFIDYFDFAKDRQGANRIKKNYQKHYRESNDLFYKSQQDQWRSYPDYNFKHMPAEVLKTLRAFGYE